MTSDALVLGAGPAGIAVALLLSKKGRSVEIIDPAFFPRPKICGEFLNPQAVQWLSENNLLGPLLALNPFPIKGMKLSDREGRSFTGHYMNNSTGYAVTRKDFDALLVSKAREAGIAISEGFRAEKLVITGQRATGAFGTTSEGRFFLKKGAALIGADGRNNLIGRTFGWMRGIPEFRKYTFQAYFDNVPELSNFGEVHLVQDGYIGIAPLTGSLANVALVVDESNHPGGDADRQAFLLAKIARSPLALRFRGLKPITETVTGGPLAFRMKRVSGSGALLVGDTCGFLDPFTGEGMNYAFLSATLAVEILERAYQSDSFDDHLLAEYDRRRHAIFARKLHISRLIQKAVAHPELATFLIRKFASDTELGDQMVSAVGCAIPVEQVWNLKFLNRIVMG